MAGFSIADFFASVSFKADDASRSRAEGSYAKFEKAVRDAETRIEKAKRDGAKAAVRYALEIEAAQAREALEAAKTAAKVVAAEELKTKAQAQGAKHSADHSAAFVRGMTAMTLAAGTAGLAITAAIVKISQSFETLYFTSQRTGASVSNIKGLSYAFAQVGSTGGSAVAAIESFARAMRTNPGIGGFVRSLGVATQEGGKARDTLDVLSDAVDKIATKHPYYTGAQMAELLGLDESQFETFNRYRKEIKDYRAEYEASLKAVGLNSAEAAKQSEHFQQALRRIGMQVSVAGQSLLVSLLPMLDRLAATISRFMTENAPALNGFFSKVGEVAQSAATGLEGFIKGFSGEEGAKRIQAWADAMNNLADGMRGVWRVIAWIQDSTFWKALTYFESPLWQFLKYAGGSAVGSAQASVGGGPGVGPGGAVVGSGAGGGGSGPTKERSWAQRNLPTWLGGDPADASGGKRRADKGANAAGAKESYDFWRSKGLTHEQASGLVGMEQGESNFNPRAVGDGGKAHGAFQHHPDRRAAILKGTGIDIDTATHQQQLEAAYWEMTQGNEKAAWAAIQRAKTPGEAASAGVYKFERPADKAGESILRGQYANEWAERFKTAGTGPTGLPDISDRSTFKGGKLDDVKGFVVHHTGGRGTPESVVDTLNQRGLGVQYVMDRDGKIFRTLPEGARGAHTRPAQNGSGLDNSNTMGMEVIAKDDRDITPAQVEASKAFLSGLQRAYPGLKVFGHGEINDHKQETEGRTIVEAFRNMSPADRAVGSAKPITLPDFGGGFNPGATDVAKLTAGQPMGASSITSTTNNGGATVTMQPTTTVHIHGGDPASNAAQFERTAGRVNDLALRNAQTAIR